MVSWCSCGGVWWWCVVVCSGGVWWECVVVGAVMVCSGVWW